jgi:DNA-binding response OmpR family regulator
VEDDMPRVVVVSTSGLVRYSLSRELQPRGFVVINVNDVGADAVHATTDAAPDVVLIDAGSASHNGRFLVKRFKQEPSLRRTPVLFLDDRVPTGIEARQKVLDDGADGVVARSDDFDALAAVLKLHLRR